jgi:uncharacterized delta-60 repeat protein
VDCLERRVLFAAGDPDPTFGAGGSIQQPMSWPGDSAVQADGKVVLVGAAGDKAVVLRFTADGAVDTTFGGGDGRVEVAPAAFSNVFYSVALQPDGKILAGGSGLARFNPDGSLDPTFGGGDGIVTDPARIYDLALAPGGKVLAWAGEFNQISGSYVVRFNADGTLVTTFGYSGAAQTASIDAGFWISGLAAAADGKPVATGSFYDPTGAVPSGVGVLRLNTDGTRDATFGRNGFATIVPAAGSLQLHDAVVQPDGKVVAAGAAAPAFPVLRQAAVVRFNADGSPDRTFGLAGTGVSPVAIAPSNSNFVPFFDGLFDVTLQPDGRIVAAGTADSGLDGPILSVVARFRADGEPDPTYSGDGIATVDLPDVNGGTPNSVSLDPQGRAVVSGYVPVGSSDYPGFVARLQADEHADGINFTGGDTLTVDGTRSPDTISVTRSGDNLVAKLNNLSRSYPAARVKRLFVFGNAGNDLISIGSAGVLGADVYGGDGNDRLSGGAGNDTLEGGLGADYLRGGAGNDTADYFRRIDNLAVSPENAANDGALAERDNVRSDIETILGGHGDDRITGSGRADSIGGGDGNDRLYGMFGDDRIDGGAGNDTLSGGAGNDWMDGGLGADSMSGGDGVDTIDYTSRDRYRGYDPGVSVTLGDSLANDGGPGEGDNAQADNVIGTAGFDFLTGSNQANVLDGGKGNDVLIGGGGDDTLLGGADSDRLDGGPGNDTLDGGAPAYEGDQQTNVADYSGRTENLTVDLSQGTATTPAGEHDRLLNIQWALGGSGNDRLVGDGNANRLVGSGGNDTLVGNAGEDTLDGGLGADRFEGGSGRDIADYSQRGDDLVITLDDVNNDGAAGEKDDVRGDVENVDGGAGNDRITGSAGDNFLFGNQGDDTVDGGAGGDVLYGDDGNDVLTGGPGKDRLNGNKGDDTLFARDGSNDDLLDGGPGIDRAQKDDGDVASNVETLLP